MMQSFLLLLPSLTVMWIIFCLFMFIALRRWWATQQSVANKNDKIIKLSFIWLGAGFGCQVERRIDRRRSRRRRRRWSRYRRENKTNDTQLFQFPTVQICDMRRLQHDTCLLALGIFIAILLFINFVSRNLHLSRSRHWRNIRHSAIRAISFFIQNEQAENLFNDSKSAGESGAQTRRQPSFLISK